MGRSQFAVCYDGPTARWAKWWVAGLRPDRRLWTAPAPLFRALLRSVLSRAHLSHLRLSPASLRPGGITERFISGVSVARLRFAGRWASEASLGVYIQEALLLKAF